MTERDALDREIAGRLRAIEEGPDLSAIGGLHEVTARGRRQRRRRHTLAAAAAVAGVVAVPVASIAVAGAVRNSGQHAVPPADLTRLLGTFTTYVSPARTADKALGGSWTMTLNGDGTVDLTAPRHYAGVVSGSDYKANGGAVRINLFVQDRCSANPVGSYRWTRDPAGLHFTPVSDLCAARRLVLTTSVWHPGI